MPRTKVWAILSTTTRIFRLAVCGCEHAALPVASRHERSLCGHARGGSAMPYKFNLDELKAAYYKVHDPDLTQAQIAVKVGLTNQATVSRLLRDARHHRVIQEVFRFPADLRPEDRLKVVNSFFARHG